MYRINGNIRHENGSLTPFSTIIGTVENPFYNWIDDKSDEMVTKLNSLYCDLLAEHTTGGDELELVNVTFGTSNIDGVFADAYDIFSLELT